NCRFEFRDRARNPSSGSTSKRRSLQGTDAMGSMNHSEEFDAAVADIPDSWWRDHLHVAVWILVASVFVLFLKFAAEAVVPFVLSGMLFYALDPAVDILEKWRVPRALGAALMLGSVLVGIGALTLVLRDDITSVVTELPAGARRL